MTPTIDNLASMDRPELLALWQQHFGRPPPPHTHASFIRHALAWGLQGGRIPRESSGRPRRAAGRSAPAKPLSPGTQLIREWQGRTYRVCVTANGFTYAGRTWRSLSAIARSITGTPWSGPAFFGVGT